MVSAVMPVSTLSDLSGMLYYLAAEARKVGEDKNKKRMAAMILILTFFVGILSESILSKIFLKNFLRHIGMENAHFNIL